MLDLLLKTKAGRIILSILWGLGLACIFRKVCTGRKCIAYRAPLPNNIVSSIYTYDGKCYKFMTKTTKCKGNTIE